MLHGDMREGSVRGKVDVYLVVSNKRTNSGVVARSGRGRQV